MILPMDSAGLIEKTDQLPPVASRAVVADGPDITLMLYAPEDGMVAGMCLGPHQAIDLAHDLLAAARRRFGRGVPA